MAKAKQPDPKTLKVNKMELVREAVRELGRDSNKKDVADLILRKHGDDVAALFDEAMLSNYVSQARNKLGFGSKRAGQHSSAFGASTATVTKESIRETMAVGKKEVVRAVLTLVEKYGLAVVKDSLDLIDEFAGA